MHAVVIAAGEGRRLRPFTERWPKPILPIDGRPVLATLLRALAEEGLGPVTLVTGHLAHEVERLVGDGSAFGIELRIAHQQRPSGSADAVARAFDAGAAPPLVIVAADTVFRRGDLRRFADEFRGSAAPGALAVRRQPPPGPGRPAVRVVAGRVLRVVDDDPTNSLGSAPLWALDSPLEPYFDRLPGPPFELSVVYQRAVDDGLTIAAVEVGATRDLTYPLDLVKENVLYLS